VGLCVVGWLFVWEYGSFLVDYCYYVIRGENDCKSDLFCKLLR
jgi:hypothetical protein